MYKPGPASKKKKLNPTSIQDNPNREVIAQAHTITEQEQLQPLDKELTDSPIAENHDTSEQSTQDEHTNSVFQDQTNPAVRCDQSDPVNKDTVKWKDSPSKNIENVKELQNQNEHQGSIFEIERPGPSPRKYKPEPASEKNLKPIPSKSLEEAKTSTPTAVIDLPCPNNQENVQNETAKVVIQESVSHEDHSKPLSKESNLDQLKSLENTLLPVAESTVVPENQLETLENTRHLVIQDVHLKLFFNSDSSSDECPLVIDAGEDPDETGYKEDDLESTSEKNHTSFKVNKDTSTLLTDSKSKQLDSLSHQPNSISEDKSDKSELTIQTQLPMPESTVASKGKVLLSKEQNQPDTVPQKDMNSEGDKSGIKKVVNPTNEVSRSKNKKGKRKKGSKITKLKCSVNNSNTQNKQQKATLRELWSHATFLKNALCSKNITSFLRDPHATHVTVEQRAALSVMRLRLKDKPSVEELETALVKLHHNYWNRVQSEAAGGCAGRAPCWFVTCEARLRAPGTKGKNPTTEWETGLAAQSELASGVWSAVRAAVKEGGGQNLLGVAVRHVAQTLGLSIERVSTLWNNMRYIAVSKLRLLVWSGDRAEAGAAGEGGLMTKPDWHIADALLLADEDMHLVTQDSLTMFDQLQALTITYHLVRAFQLEETGTALNWTKALHAYTTRSTRGTMSSLVVLQRRWYELKAHTRAAITSAHRARRSDSGPDMTHPIYWKIARAYPSVVTSPTFPSWSELVRAGAIHMDPVEVTSSGRLQDQIDNKLYEALCSEEEPVSRVVPGVGTARSSGVERASSPAPPALLDYVQEHAKPRTATTSLGSPQMPSPRSVSSSGGGSAPRVRPTREVQNKREKNRRARLKERFQLLKRQLPATQDDKKTRKSILGSAIRYIQVLRRKERECEHEKERLAREKIAAQQRLAALKLEVPPRPLRTLAVAFERSENAEEDNGLTLVEKDAETIHLIDEDLAGTQENHNEPSGDMDQRDARNYSNPDVGNQGGLHAGDIGSTALENMAEVASGVEGNRPSGLGGGDLEKKYSGLEATSDDMGGNIFDEGNTSGVYDIENIGGTEDEVGNLVMDTEIIDQEVQDIRTVEPNTRGTSLDVLTSINPECAEAAIIFSDDDDHDDDHDDDDNWNGCGEISDDLTRTDDVNDAGAMTDNVSRTDSDVKRTEGNSEVIDSNVKSGSVVETDNIVNNSNSTSYNKESESNIVCVPLNDFVDLKNSIMSTAKDIINSEKLELKDIFIEVVNDENSIVSSQSTDTEDNKQEETSLKNLKTGSGKIETNETKVNTVITSKAEILEIEIGPLTPAQHEQDNKQEETSLKYLKTGSGEIETNETKVNTVVTPKAEILEIEIGPLTPAQHEPMSEANDIDIVSEDWSHAEVRLHRVDSLLSLSYVHTSHSSVEVEGIRPSGAEYSTEDLSRNPDFDIRLKGLSASFLSLPSNRVLLGRCVPLTVDLVKLPPLLSSRISRSRDTRIQLPDIEEVRRVNRSLLTAQVAPTTHRPAHGHQTSPPPDDASSDEDEDSDNHSEWLPSDEENDVGNSSDISRNNDVNTDDDVSGRHDNVSVDLTHRGPLTHDELISMLKDCNRFDDLVWGKGHWSEIGSKGYCCLARKHVAINTARRRMQLNKPAPITHVQDVNIHQHPDGLSCSCCCARLLRGVHDRALHIGNVQRSLFRELANITKNSTDYNSGDGNPGGDLQDDSPPDAENKKTEKRKMPRPKKKNKVILAEEDDEERPKNDLEEWERQKSVNEKYFRLSSEESIVAPKVVNPVSETTRPVVETIIIEDNDSKDMSLKSTSDTYEVVLKDRNSKAEIIAEVGMEIAEMNINETVKSNNGSDTSDNDEFIDEQIDEFEENDQTLVINEDEEEVVKEDHTEVLVTHNLNTVCQSETKSVNVNQYQKSTPSEPSVVKKRFVTKVITDHDKRGHNHFKILTSSELNFAVGNDILGEDTPSNVLPLTQNNVERHVKMYEENNFPSTFDLTSSTSTKSAASPNNVSSHTSSNQKNSTVSLLRPDKLQKTVQDKVEQLKSVPDGVHQHQKTAQDTIHKQKSVQNPTRPAIPVQNQHEQLKIVRDPPQQQKLVESKISHVYLASSKIPAKYLAPSKIPAKYLAPSKIPAKYLAPSKIPANTPVSISKNSSAASTKPQTMHLPVVSKPFSLTPINTDKVSVSHGNTVPYPQLTQLTNVNPNVTKAMPTLSAVLSGEISDPVPAKVLNPVLNAKDVQQMKVLEFMPKITDVKSLVKKEELPVIANVSSLSTNLTSVPQQNSSGGPMQAVISAILPLGSAPDGTYHWMVPPNSNERQLTNANPVSNVCQSDTKTDIPSQSVANVVKTSTNPVATVNPAATGNALLTEKVDKNPANVSLEMGKKLVKVSSKKMMRKNKVYPENPRKKRLYAENLLKTLMVESATQLVHFPYRKGHDCYNGLVAWRKLSGARKRVPATMWARRGVGPLLCVDAHAPLMVLADHLLVTQADINVKGPTFWTVAPWRSCKEVLMDDTPPVSVSGSLYRPVKLHNGTVYVPVLSVVPTVYVAAGLLQSGGSLQLLGRTRGEAVPLRQCPRSGLVSCDDTDANNALQILFQELQKERERNNKSSDVITSIIVNNDSGNTTYVDVPVADNSSSNVAQNSSTLMIPSGSVISSTSLQNPGNFATTVGTSNNTAPSSSATVVSSTVTAVNRSKVITSSYAVRNSGNSGKTAPAPAINTTNTASTCNSLLKRHIVFPKMAPRLVLSTRTTQSNDDASTLLPNACSQKNAQSTNLKREASNELLEEVQQNDEESSSSDDVEMMELTNDVINLNDSSDE